MYDQARRLFHTTPADLDSNTAKEETRKRARQIAELHELLVAEHKHAVLIILQGMDASGKDGAMRNVFGACSPNGLSTFSFKKPTETEFAHDFLWRVHQQVPAKGEMIIFNRSHYEDVLIQRVHGWIDEERARRRLDSINAFEELLQYDNNTVILKFYLHISHEQQGIELQQRLEERDKHWKHNPGDWREREHWDQYRAAYESAINHSTIPWHIVPVDKRWYRDYIISDVVLRALQGLDMQWPELKKEE